MLPRRVRRASVPLLPLLLLVALTACSGAEPPERVVAGSNRSIGQSAPPTTTAASIPVAEATSTTVVAAEPVGSDPSPVAGLDAGRLAALVAEPAGASVRALGGPSLEQVRVDATVAWRIRIPGPVTVRSARGEVLVGARVVGQAIAAPDLGSLVTVTLDPTGLVAGAPVAVRWEGGEPQAVGPLAVVR